MSRYTVLKEQNVSLLFDVRELSAPANTSCNNRLLHGSLRCGSVRSNFVVYYSHDSKIWKLKYNFWDVTPCSIVEVYWCFGLTYCLHLQGWRVNQRSNQQAETEALLLNGYLLGFLVHADDRNSAYLRDVGNLLPNYMASHPTRYCPSYVTAVET
jgi:hypothetical protein